MLARLDSATPRRRPIVATTSTAIPSPSIACLVTSRPVISSPAASARPSDDPGWVSAAILLPSERGARRQHLDAAAVRAVALAGRARLIDDHVAELGAGAGGAAVELAAEHEPAADSGADREQHGVRGALRGTEPVLGERREVGVVVEEGGQVEPLLDELSERHVDDRQVHRADRLPRRWSIVDGIPIPIASACGQARSASWISDSSRGAGRDRGRGSARSTGGGRSARRRRPRWPSSSRPDPLRSPPSRGGRREESRRGMGY